QGRFPIRVELTALALEDLVRILTEPRNALVAQYRALLQTEGVDLAFTDEAVREMARFAMEVNTATENIGARRLATLLEPVLDEVSFEGGASGPRRVVIDAPEVRQKLEPLVKSQDLRRFILSAARRGPSSSRWARPRPWVSCGRPSTRAAIRFARSLG